MIDDEFVDELKAVTDEDGEFKGEEEKAYLDLRNWINSVKRIIQSWMQQKSMRREIKVLRKAFRKKNYQKGKLLSGERRKRMLQSRLSFSLTGFRAEFWKEQQTFPYI